MEAPVPVGVDALAAHRRVCFRAGLTPETILRWGEEEEKVRRGVEGKGKGGWSQALSVEHEEAERRWKVEGCWRSLKGRGWKERRIVSVRS